ncbi:protein translocase subunit SecD [Mameliella alba]|nr:protein translocase subunit SecD [Antarctobacter heliothermus]MBY6143691.1 protein translocase subunit SecD [Mameliella alba]MCA0952585.1 protein translocase subunit SecD [Mameliella alba]
MKRPTLLKRLGVWGICLLCLWLALPNAFYNRVDTYNTAAENTAITAPEGWPNWLPTSLFNLGLDLRGGAHLLAEVDTQEVISKRLDALWPDLRDALRAEGGTESRVRRLDAPEGELRVSLTADIAARAEQVASGFATRVVTPTGATDLDLAIALDGDTLILRYSETGTTALTDQLVAQSLEVVRRRIDEAGTREPTILRQGSDRILIEVPGFSDADALKALIGTTAQLSFHPVLTEPSADAMVLPAADQPETTYRLDPRPVVSGQQLTDAQATFDQNGRPAVSFRFDASGARAFGAFTASHVGSPFAIVLDDEVLSAPVIQSHIAGGNGIITGQFSTEDSTRLATLLRAGSLPADLTFLEEKTVGPELGSDSIAAGLKAALAGLVAVCVLMVGCYGGLGLMAVGALAINMVILMAVLTVVGATLTLPGMAGLVLTLGMAVDANVLIFERIREEARKERNLWRAVGNGFDNAFSSILDANITGLLTAGLMFWLGAGPVRGFAVTLGLGILTSMFTALVVTKLILQGWLEWRHPKVLPLNGLFRFLNARPVLDFFRLQWVTLGASALAVLASAALIATLGLNLGIDFTGGTSLRIETPHLLQFDAYRSALDGLGLTDVALSEVFSPGSGGDSHVATLRIAAEGIAALSAEQMAAVRAALWSVDPDLAFTASETIGGKVSPELVRAALMAISGGVLSILGYVWLRFEWQFALGAVMALAHDVILTLGLFALLGLKIDLAFVAALLTILGYSINDTVVVFDRVRENLRRHVALPLRDVMNLSACETLSRTLLTSATTLVALVALLVLGGDVIRGFALAITFGVLVGTYSSIYVAKNIVLFLGVDRRPAEDRRIKGQFDHIEA